MESLFQSASGKKLKVNKGSFDKTASLIQDSDKFSNISGANEEIETQTPDNLDFSEILKDPILRTKESDDFKFQSPGFLSTPKTNDFSKIRPTQPNTQFVTQLPSNENSEGSRLESQIIDVIEKNRKKYKSKTVQKNYDYDDIPDNLEVSKTLSFYMNTFSLDHVLDRVKTNPNNAISPISNRITLTDLERYKVKSYKDKRIKTEMDMYKKEAGLNTGNILEFSCKFLNIEKIIENTTKQYKNTEITKEWASHHLKMILFNVLSYARMFPTLKIDMFNESTIQKLLEERSNHRTS